MDDPAHHITPPRRRIKRHLRHWPARCSPSAKAVMISALLLAFMAQTFFVYADPTPTVTLHPQAMEGRRAWLANNCQACHQVYGFGGFLGPDLTNAASRIDRSQLEYRLATGSDQMPSFEMDQDEINALWSYLESLNATGIGQARNPLLARQPGTIPAPQQALADMIALGAPEGVALGYETFTASNCSACHVLFGESFIGAPDLSTTLTRITPGQLDEVLEHGRAPLMPPTGYTPEQRRHVHALIAYMNEHRQQAIANAPDDSDTPFWRTLPWWDF